MFDGRTPPSDIVVLRHGHFPGNALSQSMSTTDREEAAMLNNMARGSDFTVGLDEQGRAQGMQVGTVLRQLLPDVRICLSSDYPRAREMAAIALPGAQVTLDDRLRERDRGRLTGIPRSRAQAVTETLNAVYGHQLPYTKDSDPLGWWPIEGEPLKAKREWFRNVLPYMAEVAPNQPIAASTHGEVVIAARSAKELGNMSNADLLRGLTPDCPGLTVDNGQFDWWTRRDPDTGVLAPVITHVRSISVCQDPPLDTGFIRIREG